MTRNTWPTNLLLGLGAVLLLCGSLITVLERSLFQPQAFGQKVAGSLDDPRVAAFAAEQIAGALQKANPDLIMARPLIVGTAEGLVASRPFRALVETGAEKAHVALFSEGARTLVLALPDVEVLLRGALAQASPALAAKIPANLQAAIANLGHGNRLGLLIDVWRLGIRLAWLAGFLLLAAPVLMAASVLTAPSRRRALFRNGVALCVVGFLVTAILPLGSMAAVLLVEDPGLRGLAQGLWQSFASDAKPWGLFLAGFGVLLCAGATSLLEAVNPLESAQRILLFFVSPPVPFGWRLAWGGTLLGVGLLAIVFPQAVLSALVVVAGGCCAYAGIRELFRLLLLRVDRLHAVEAISEESRWVLHGVLVATLVAGCAGLWFWLRSPSIQVAAASGTLACNGLPELCGRRVDQVVFPGAHNAMSNQQIPGWMFPHHEKNIAGQLTDGVRALLFDVHYGLPGGARIKTDLSAGVNREKMLKALGAEGFEAAMRIRGRLVGVEEGRRGLYLCHGLCELGAYELRPALESIREFLVHHPDEVLVLIVEDYVTPRDLAAEFEQSGLAGLVYAGQPGAQWPTLRELIEAGRRVVVFIESGRPGVPWLRPAFENVQETPYSFHKPEEFTCAPNRGGTAGALFLMNHWIETTPTPKPSNAQLVNAHGYLLARAKRCTEERRHLPNILAVDFYGTGDVVGVARELNGTAGNF